MLLVWQNDCTKLFASVQQQMLAMTKGLTRIMKGFDSLMAVAEADDPSTYKRVSIASSTEKPSFENHFILRTTEAKTAVVFQTISVRIHRSHVRCGPCVQTDHLS